MITDYALQTLSIRIFYCLFSNIDAEIVSLHHFTPAMMVEACVRCLKAINSDFSSPVVMPEAMSAKYRMCSSLASACQVTQLSDLKTLNVLF